MVIPENGYILYGDNNPDNPSGDHYHTYYDFYNTDLGKAISDGVEITDGLAYKKYEKGLIAYNRTKFKYTVKFKDGKKVNIGPLEGVFFDKDKGSIEGKTIIDWSRCDDIYKPMYCYGGDGKLISKSNTKSDKKVLEV